VKPGGRVAGPEWWQLHEERALWLDWSFSLLPSAILLFNIKLSQQKMRDFFSRLRSPVVEAKTVEHH
jgi:hypothetical protein